MLTRYPSQACSSVCFSTFISGELNSEELCCIRMYSTMYMYVQQSYHCTFYKLALTRISSRHFEKRGEIRVFRNKQGGGGGEESCISLCIGGSTCKWHMLPQEILFSWLFVHPHHSCSSLLTWLTCSRRLDMLPLHREYNSANVLILCCAVTCYSIIIGANNHVCCYSS